MIGHPHSICENPTSVFDFVVLDANKRELPLSQFRGRPMLIMNVASRSANTESGYKLATTLYDKYKNQGLMVLGFPCNQFGGEEPGNEDEILRFAHSHYGVEFPILAKVDVNGDNADPLWRWLKQQKPGVLATEFIKWNFTAFLTDRDGKVWERFAPGVSIDDVEKVLVPLLPLQVGQQPVPTTTQPITSETRAHPAKTQPIAGETLHVPTEGQRAAHEVQPTGYDAR
jgi:glutathione peroxidase-type tryparedoxin peroxidase